MTTHPCNHFANGSKQEEKQNDIRKRESKNNLRRDYRLITLPASDFETVREILQGSVISCDSMVVTFYGAK